MLTPDRNNVRRLRQTPADQYTPPVASATFSPGRSATSSTILRNVTQALERRYLTAHRSQAVRNSRVAELSELMGHDLRQ